MATIFWSHKHQHKRGATGIAFLKIVQQYPILKFNIHSPQKLTILPDTPLLVMFYFLISGGSLSKNSLPAHSALGTLCVYCTVTSFLIFLWHKVLRELKVSLSEQKESFWDKDKILLVKFQSKKKAANTYQPRNKDNDYQEIIFLQVHEALGFILSAKKGVYYPTLRPKEKISLQEMLVLFWNDPDSLDRRKAREPFQKFGLTRHWNSTDWDDLRRPKTDRMKKERKITATVTPTPAPQSNLPEILWLIWGLPR